MSRARRFTFGVRVRKIKPGDRVYVKSPPDGTFGWYPAMNLPSGPSYRVEAAATAACDFFYISTSLFIYSEDWLEPVLKKEFRENDLGKTP